MFVDSGVFTIFISYFALFLLLIYNYSLKTGLSVRVFFIKTFYRFFLKKKKH